MAWEFLHCRHSSSGDFVGPIEGEVVDDPEYGSDYGIELGDGTLEPAAPFRFLNHSCQPNCELIICDEDDDDPVLGRLSVWLGVLGEIAADEPLTIDYAWPADAAIPCQCGTAACRGWIVAEEQRETLDKVAQLGLIAFARRRVLLPRKEQHGPGRQAIAGDLYGHRQPLNNRQPHSSGRRRPT